MKKSQKFPEWAIPVGVIVVVSLMALFGVTRLLELKILDLYTHLIPEPVERPEVVVIDVDDAAIQNVGQWPWSRNLHANYLADLRSLGADSLSFDVEFVDRGPVGVSSRERDAALTTLGAEMGSVFDALKAKQLAPGEAADAAKTILHDGILQTARDNDEYLGQALKVFGRAFTTLNYNLDNSNDDALKAREYLMEHSSVGPVTGRLDLLKEVPDLRGAIVPIASRAAGASVTNVVKDEDGTLRRINLLFRVKGSDKVFGQMAFVPVWVRLGQPAIEVEASRIILKTSLLKDNPQPDVVIPLANSGNLLEPTKMMVINWPHGKYFEGFKHVKVSELQEFDERWADLKRHVKAMQDVSFVTSDLMGPVEQYEVNRQAALVAGDQAGFDQAELERSAWLAAVADLNSGKAEAELKAVLSAQAQDPKIPQASKDKIPGLVKDIEKTFAKLQEKKKAYDDLRLELSGKLKGALTFYGWTSVATTDIGVNPFDPVYYNVGTHAAVANTILSGGYLNEWPSWGGVLLGALVAFGVFLILPRLGTLTGVGVGFGVFLALMVGIGVFYAVTGIYPGALVPGMIVFLSALGLTLAKFWGSEVEKRFIRGAFGTYLSPEVIKQLEADPDKLKLGGEKKVLTAVFTDVKGFSTFSESMDPNELVALLNGYLTEMSDIILDTRGTIDKFEGDAIIAFWGAPLSFDDHAPRAVSAALRMKLAEAAMNERFQRDKLAPSPLLTRIGINTGEMTVGNMGTARRMDYTMMGNSVNLAARLEGVNKVYGTWILTTQQTRDRLDDSIIVRKLDRVRVVGISTPVRLFEVTAFRDGVDPKVLEKVELFERGIDAYEQRQWDEAKRLFEGGLSLDPNDGPCRAFLERTAKNRTAGLDERWDGVFNLTTK